MSDSEEQKGPKGGPRTAAGKAVAALNATRHGLRANSPVIPGIEDPEEWNEHCSGIVESLRPVGLLEIVLAERVALLLWRMHRVARYEAAVLAVRARGESGEWRTGAMARRRGRPSALLGLRPGHPLGSALPRDAGRSHRALAQPYQEHRH